MEALAAPADAATRCGIDTVEIARIERLLRESAPQDLRRLFSQQELADSGDGAGRTASLAAGPPWWGSGRASRPSDFAVTRDAYGAAGQIDRAARARGPYRTIALS